MRTRRRFLRGALMAIGLPVLALLLLVAAVVTWQLTRDPLSALPRVPGEMQVLATERESIDGREWRQVHLEARDGRRMEIQISLPDPMPAEPAPVVLILGGLRTGAGSVERLPEAGRNVLVGYEWPIPRSIPRGTAAVPMLPEVYRRILFVPGELSAVLRWITAQSWADRDRITLVGLSLGALAAPAVQRVATAEGVTISWTVLGYGGSPLGNLVAHHPRIRDAWFRPHLRAGADLLFRPLEPTEHLPHLKGTFFVLGSSDDVFIPERAAHRFAILTPEPKTVYWMEGAHLGVGADRDALLEKVIGEIVQWLLRQDAVDASGHESAGAIKPSG